MRETILDIQPHFNERWPRKGFFFVPTFILYKGDKLIFDWSASESNRELYIEIEKTDYKAEDSSNKENLVKLDLRDSYEFNVPNTGLYNIPIENPKHEEGKIGQLTIIREYSGNNKDQRSPYPERFYKYSLKKQDGGLIKYCTDWGYLTSIGACVLDKYEDEIDLLDKIYDSRNMDFHVIEETKKRIDKSVYFWVKKGEDIVIETSKKDIDGFVTTIDVEKKNRVGFWGKFDSRSKFTSNEDSIYKLTASIYSLNYNFEGIMPSDFCDIKIYGNKESFILDFNKDYELVDVYNEVFNKVEKEPIKISC